MIGWEWRISNDTAVRNPLINRGSSGEQTSVHPPVATFAEVRREKGNDRYVLTLPTALPISNFLIETYCHSFLLPQIYPARDARSRLHGYNNSNNRISRCALSPRPWSIVLQGRIIPATFNDDRLSHRSQSLVIGTCLRAFNLQSPKSPANHAHSLVAIFIATTTRGGGFRTILVLARTLFYEYNIRFLHTFLRF